MNTLSKQKKEENKFLRSLIPKAKAFIQRKTPIVEIHICDKKTKVHNNVKRLKFTIM